MVQRTYVSKQTDQQTLAVVQGPCNTMTPVAPGSQPSSGAIAFVAAINGALAPRLDGIQGQMGMMAAQMTSLKSDVVEVQHHDQRMIEFERQLKDITAGRSTWSGAASSAASSEPHPEPARGSGA